MTTSAPIIGVKNVAKPPRAPVITTQSHFDEPADWATKHAEKGRCGRSWTCQTIANLVIIMSGLVAGSLSLAHAGPPPPTAAQINAEERALRVFAARSYLTELRRAEHVTYVLLKEATPYCVNQRKYSLGVPPISADDLPNELRRGFAESLATDRPELWRFMHVHRSSPVAKAGAQEGDVLLSMTDLATNKALAPSWVINRPPNTFSSNEPVTLAIERNGVARDLLFLPQLICDLKLKLSRTDSLVARIDAGTIVLSTGLLRFISNDSELALLLAHQLMHEQFRLARISRKEQTSGHDRREGAYAAEEEYQADYLSVYLVASAGFNPTQAVDVWKRIASNPQWQLKDGLGVRYPLTPTRSFYLSSINDEIRSKTLAGQRIVPNGQSTTLLPKWEVAAADMSYSPDSTNPPSTPLPKTSALHSITNIPFVNNEGLTGYQRFLNSPIRPRAFAIGPDNGSGWAFRTGANAAADALARCSVTTGGTCYLYAIDDQVVWNPETARHLPEPGGASATGALLTEAPPATNFAAIDDLKAVPLPLKESSRYKAFLEKPSPRAFVISEDNRSRYWLGPAALHDALAYCSRSETPCWLYAVNDSVVWSKDPAKRISSREQLTSSKEESGFLEK